MSAICNYCKKRPSVIIPGNYLCSHCHAAGIGSPRMFVAITDPGATRHCLDLDLAHDLGGALT